VHDSLEVNEYLVKIAVQERRAKVDRRQEQIHPHMYPKTDHISYLVPTACAGADRRQERAVGEEHTM